MRKLAIAVVTDCTWSLPSHAQEQWAGMPVPPAVGSAGTISGTEYVTASCNLRAPGNFRCADAPNSVRDVYIPISEFARWDTVDAIAQDVRGLAGDVAQIDLRIDALESVAGAQGAAIIDLRRRQDRDRTAMRQGVAAAIAIGNASMPSAPGRTSYDINVASFRGEQAVGVSLKYRLNLSDPTAVSVGFSSSGQRNQAARVGISGEF